VRQSVGLQLHRLHRPFRGSHGHRHQRLAPEPGPLPGDARARAHQVLQVNTSARTVHRLAAQAHLWRLELRARLCPEPTSLPTRDDLVAEVEVILEAFRPACHTSQRRFWAPIGRSKAESISNTRVSGSRASSAGDDGGAYLYLWQTGPWPSSRSGRCWRRLRGTGSAAPADRVRTALASTPSSARPGSAVSSLGLAAVARPRSGGPSFAKRVLGAAAAGRARRPIDLAEAPEKKRQRRMSAALGLAPCRARVHG